MENREIKFRAWDGKYKEMTYDVGCGDYESGDASMGWWAISSKRVFTPDGTDEDSGLMQFTGLKDKNGKEGYHKDIIDHPMYGRGVIEWYQNGWAIYYDDMIEGKSWMEFELKESEIIGNIYENPELIKQVNEA